MAIATVNPATGDVIRSFTPHSQQEVLSRVDQAHNAFLALRKTSFEQRAKWLTQAAELLEKNYETIAKMLVVEMGKPIAQAEAEVLKCAKGLRYYAKHAQSIMQNQRISDPSTVGALEAYKKIQPLGVVLAVMPWNYPLWQAVRFAAPALSAGNTVLLKHASNVPQTALFLEELFGKSGFPAGSFTTLLIGASDVKGVIEHPLVTSVTLTGSEPAGRAVAAVAGQEIKKSLLELGGSDPFIVMPSADVDAALSTAVKARIQNNGQSCIAGKRFIIHSAIYDQFAERFASAMASLRVGDPMDRTTDVGPIATEGGLRDLLAFVDDAVAKGARVLTGGRQIQGVGWYFEPTVISEIPQDADLTYEEAFGPLASLYKVDSREDALEIANQTRFGLSSAVWTNDNEDKEFFIENIDAGAVFINGMTTSYMELPFGGIKASGYGRELSSEGLLEFTNIKTIWVT